MASAVGAVALRWVIDSMNIYTVLVPLLIIVLIVYLFWSSGEKSPPGPTRWPILGSYPQIATVGREKLHVFLQQIREKYGPVAQIYFGSYPAVVVSGYEDVHDVLVKQNNVMTERPNFIPSIRTIPHLRDGLFFSNGNRWMESRKTMISAVSLVEKRQQFEVMLQEEIREIIKQFVDMEESSFQPYSHFRLSAVAIHLSGILGKRYGREDPEYQKFVNPFHAINDNVENFSPSGTIPLLQCLPFTNRAFRLSQDGYEGLDRATKSELEDRQSCFNESQIQCVLDVFIREQRRDLQNKSFADDHVAACVSDFLLGGGAGVPNTLDWALLFLVAYPEVQKKCREEIDEVCGKKDPVKFSHIDKLPYLTATVYETQRMGSAVPTTARCPVKDVTIKDYSIPKGTMILVDLRSVLMDEVQWTKPKQFNPDRFLDNDGKLIEKPSAFMPFGIGVRMCPGYTISEKTIIVVLANLLQSLEFTSSGEVNLEGKCGAGLFPASNEIIAKKRHN